MKLPRNGKELLNARRRGEQPKGMVIIDLVRNKRFSNFTLYPDMADTQGIDWSPILGLDVEVLTNKGFPFVKLVLMLAEIADGVPNSIQLTYTEGPQIAMGRSNALPRSSDGLEYRLFDWVPEAIGGPSYADSKRLERHFRREVGRRLPDRWINTMQIVASRLEQGKEAWQA